MKNNQQFSNNTSKQTFYSKSVFFILVLLVFSFISTNVMASSLIARLDRSTITLGETVTLIIETSGSSIPDPDLSPLTKDFDIVNTGHSSQTQIINGHRTDKNQLNISIKPHHMGKFTIPEIEVGNDKIYSLELTVKDIPTVSQSQSGQSIWLEITTPLKNEKNNIVVQQEIPVTVKLFTSLPLNNISISQPSPEKAISEKLGNNIQYMTKKNGKEYQVVEQHYVIFPEQSGELIVPPLVLQATKPDPQQQRYTSPFGNDMFNDPFFKNAFRGNSQIQQMLQGSSMLFGNKGKPLTLRSNGLKFKVNSIPQQAQGNSWLPARNVSLKSSWKENPPILKSGEPTTLTITIKAEGLTSANIPAITIADKKGSYRVYDEPMETENLTDGEKVTGISQQTFTIIPEQDGKLIFPAIKQSWWNTQTHKMEIAQINEITLNVLKGDITNSTNTIKNDNTIVNNKSLSDDTSTENLSELTNLNKTKVDKNLLQKMIQSKWLFIIVVMLITLNLFILFYKRNKISLSQSEARHQTKTSVQKKESDENKKLIKTVLQEAIAACESGDAEIAARSIIQWARLKWPELSVVSLLDIAGNIKQGSKNIHQLHQFIYQPNNHKKTWQDSELAKLLKQGLKIKDSNKRSYVKQSLPPLYAA
ncbi:MAG: hypothetical protein DRQ43_01770 [Gammaproteobacteria bacterium]|nr:MAG: hypothetical protein DRQ43_01770 [Gammaproteobacteria bacterium]